MRKSNLPVALKTLIKYHTKDGTLRFDCPIQRASGQWNNYAASLLIHSMLSDYIIPNIYFRKKDGDGKAILEVLDGKQRLTACMGFVDDGWSLHPKTPEVELDGEKYDIALKTFSELDEAVKQEILNHRFTIFQLEDCTDEEVEETFARINSGVALSKIQSARPVLGMELAGFFNGLCSHPFFQTSLNLTPAQWRREDDFLTLMTIAMLVEDLYFKDFKIKTSSSAAECVRFAEVVRDDYSDEKRELMESVVGYLDSAFGKSEKKFLKKTNAVIVGYLAVIMLEDNIEAHEYAEAVTSFFESDETEAYKEASGSGNVKMVNVNVRIKELLNYLKAWYPDRLGKPEVPEVPEEGKDEELGTSAEPESEDNMENSVEGETSAESEEDNTESETENNEETPAESEEDSTESETVSSEESSVESEIGTVCGEKTPAESDLETVSSEESFAELEVENNIELDSPVESELENNTELESVLDSVGYSDEEASSAGLEPVGVEGMEVSDGEN